jgi:FdhE protein
VKRPTWDQRIERARKLSSTNPAAAELLTFYAKIATFQKDVARQLVDGLDDVASRLPDLLVLVQREGPRKLAEEAAAQEFFTLALQQPYIEHLAARSGFALTNIPAAAPFICPFCQSKPVVAVLRGEGDGAKRSLICSLCSLEVEFRRILCPACGEQDRERLPVYSSAEFDYVRVEACDTCHIYIKAVDLTKNGLALPVVDEIASVVLDIWADEHGYEKLQTNLLGF